MNTRHALTMLDCLRMQKNLYAWHPGLRNYQPLNNNDWSKVIQDEISRAVCFKIDNVADMVMAAAESKHKPADVDLAKLPCVRLPYQTIWMEHMAYAPAPEDDPLGRFAIKSKRNRIGILMGTVERTVEEMVQIQIAGGRVVDDHVMNHLNHLRQANGLLHQINIEVFCQDGDKPVYGPLYYNAFLLHADGSVAEGGVHELDCDDSTKTWIADAVAIPFQALALLHCRNVSVIEKEPPTTINERHRRKHPPMVKYKMLSIKPMGKRFSQSAAPGTPGSAETPYHICRGHLKTFNEKPLLGRVRGTFWWGDFARGSKKHGEVVKDYDIKPSKGDSHDGASGTAGSAESSTQHTPHPHDDDAHKLAQEGQEHRPPDGSSQGHS